VQIADARGLTQFGNEGPCLVCSDDWSFFCPSALKTAIVKEADPSYPSLVPGYVTKQIACICEDQNKLDLVRP
jgi:hypothetical protein